MAYHELSPGLSHGSLSNNPLINCFVSLLTHSRREMVIERKKFTCFQISELLRLPDIRDRAWQIQGCSALNGEGLKVSSAFNILCVVWRQ